MIKICKRITSYLFLYLDMIMKKDIGVVFFCLGSEPNIRKSIFSFKKNYVPEWRKNFFENQSIFHRWNSWFSILIRVAFFLEVVIFFFDSLWSWSRFLVKTIQFMNMMRLILFNPISIHEIFVLFHDFNYHRKKLSMIIFQIFTE